MKKLALLLCLLIFISGCGKTVVDPYPLIVESAAVSLSPEASASAAPAAPEVIISQPESEPSPFAAAEPAPEPTPVETKTVSFLAVGDNLLHNTVMDFGKQSDGTYNYDALYKDIAYVISAADLAAVNQETPLVYDSAKYSSYPEFGTPTAIGDALVSAGFDIVTMATNHTCDKGDSGIADSLDFWRTRHPETALLGLHSQAAEPVTVVEKNGIKIALLDYTYGFNGGGPSNGWMVDTLGDEAAIRAKMSEAENAADCTIVFLHAGTEYQHSPDDYQRRWAKVFADAGADAIIGSHPHVLQPMETLITTTGQAVPVWWSLGNFMSHQIETARWLGGMATFDIVKTGDSVTIENPALNPVFTYIWHEGSVRSFKTVPLSDLTQDMVNASYYCDYYGTVDALWQLFDDIVG